MASARKIVLLPASNVLAHAGRCALLARELKKRHHDVILAGTPKYLRDPEVADEEFGYYPLPDFDAGLGLKILRDLSSVPNRHMLEEHIHAELKMIDELKPDLAIVDFRLTMFISAKMKGLPTVSLIGGRWVYQYSAQPLQAFRTHPYYSQLRWIIRERGVERLVPFLHRLVLRYKMGPYRDLLKKHHLEAKRDLWDLIIGDYNLVLDTELLAPTKGLPKNFQRVGPIYWSSESPLPAWIDELERDRPIIYVTMGSTSHPSLFKKLMDILGNEPYQVIMTTGGQIDPQKLRLPANFRVERFLPGERIMEMADLVICHGGAGTVYQAVKTATPCIIITTHFEQEFLGAEVENQGAGLFLAMGEVMAKSEVVRTAVDRMLGHLDSYRTKIARLQKDLLRYNALTEAADGIEQFMASRPASSGRSFPSAAGMCRDDPRVGPHAAFTGLRE